MGRKKGSKNKKTIINIPLVSSNINEKETKKEIKRLKRLKLACRAGSIERIELHRKIIALKNKLNEQTENIDPIKKELMEKIYDAKPYLKVIGVDLNKFSIEELQHHYDTKIKKG